MYLNLFQNHSQPFFANNFIVLPQLLPLLELWKLVGVPMLCQVNIDLKVLLQEKFIYHNK